MPKRSDVFAVLIAIFVLGAGAYLSTFPTEIIREFGLLLMGGSLIGLVIWFAWEKISPATWTPDGKINGGYLACAKVWLALAQEVQIGREFARKCPVNHCSVTTSIFATSQGPLWGAAFSFIRSSIHWITRKMPRLVAGAQVSCSELRQIADRDPIGALFAQK
jgi:hypothetical protein